MSARSFGFKARVAWLAGFAVLLLLIRLLTDGVYLTQSVDPDDVAPDGGKAYRFVPDSPRLLGVPLPGAVLESPSNDFTSISRSRALLFEDGVQLGPPHSLHANIRDNGAGQFSHWMGEIWFSASDSSDVRSNGRGYTLRLHYTVPETARPWAKGLAFAIAGLLVLAAVWILYRESLNWRRIAVLAAVAVAGIAVLAVASGLLFVAAAGVLATALAMLVVTLALALISGRLANRATPWINNWGLLVGALGVLLVLLEAALLLFGPEIAAALAPTPKAQPVTVSIVERPDPLSLVPEEARAAIVARSKHATLPEDWKRRDTTVEGASSAYYWHEVLHVYDANGFRRSASLPEDKDPSVLRIMVIGDSLTYGVGLDARWIYASVLEDKLAEEFRVETINLGVPGYQSEDVFRVLRTFYDRLEPDLVVYGICQNDFLESGQGQFTRKFVDLPEALLKRARLIRFTQDQLNGSARALGVSLDFYDEILNHAERYQERFARNLLEMNAFVKERGGRPIVALVLDQFPGLGTRGAQLTEIAEAAAHEAGMTVVPTADYYRVWSGSNFAVSRWEGHPNEIASELFADMLSARIRALGGLDAFRKDLGGSVDADGPATGTAEAPSDPS